MKCIFKYVMCFLLIAFLFIGNVSAKNVCSYNSAKTNINKYYDYYTDNDLYLVRGKNVAFGFNNGDIYVDSNFSNPGLLNEDEYHSSGGSNSYLYDGSSTGTMTIVNIGGEERVKMVSDSGNVIDVSHNEESGFKTTHYVQPDVKVTGIGSFEDPFVFVKKSRSFVNNYDYTGKQEKITIQYDGTYEFLVNGAQGKNGGKGGQIKTSLSLKAGDEVSIVVGGQVGKFGGGSGQSYGGDSSRIYVNGVLELAAGGGGGGSTSSVGGINTATSVGGADVGSGSGLNGQMYSGGGSSAGWNGTTASACSKYNGTSYCTQNQTTAACGYTSTFDKTTATCDGSTTGYTKKYVSCLRRIKNYSKVTRRCVDGYEVHVYTCDQTPSTYENVHHKCSSNIGSYTKTTKTCNSTVSSYNKKIYKCNSTTTYTKTTKRCVKSGTKYSFSSSSTSSSSCSTGSWFLCNKNSVGKSYVSGCKANTNNSWTSTSSTSSSCSATSSFSCSSSTKNRTYTTCSANITNSWSTSSSTTGTCVTGSSFSCTSSTKGRSYVSSCSPKYNYFFTTTRQNSSTNGATGSAFTCNSATLNRSYVTSSVLGYSYNKYISRSYKSSTQGSFLSSADGVACNASTLSNYKAGRYGTSLQAPTLESSTSTSSSCAVQAGVDERIFCGRTNGSGKSYVQSCTPNYEYYKSSEKTDSNASSCSVSSSQTCNTSGVDLTTSCNKNNSYYFTDNTQYGLSSCSTTGSFSCGSSTIGSTYVKSCKENRHNKTCCTSCARTGNSGQGGRNYIRSGVANTSTTPSGYKTGNGSITISFNGQVDS